MFHAILVGLLTKYSTIYHPHLTPCHIADYICSITVLDKGYSLEPLLVLLYKSFNSAFSPYMPT